MSVQDDVIRKSVTAGDVMDYQGKGVVNFVMPYFWATPRIFALPTDLPPYWSYQRDVVLRNTILYESYWASAVAIAVNKIASQSFDVKGDVPRRVSDAQQLLVQWGGESYVMGMSKLMMDYFCCDNGAFIEIVRQSSAAGSKILGLLHLDSLRVQRTGDPDIPVLFRDLHGALHELKDYQVLEFTDMPDPGYSWLGVGHCAAERAYDQIYKLAGMTRTVNEKITGSGAHQLALISGLSPKQMGEIITTAQNEASAKGLLYYLGTILSAIQSDMPIDIKTLQLRGLPENFDQKETLDEVLLAYANSLGLVLTDLQPLAHQGLGTGKQAETLEEKAQGRTIATFRKVFTHKLNEWVMPDQVTFYFKERDLRDEQGQAAVALAREQVRASMVTTGEITAQEARQLAVDSDDLPHEFITVDQTGQNALGDEERANANEQITPIATATSPNTPPPAPVQPPAKAQPQPAATKELSKLARQAEIKMAQAVGIELVTKENDEIYALRKLQEEIKETREALEALAHEK
jgi:hypothetical protein